MHDASPPPGAEPSPPPILLTAAGTGQARGRFAVAQAPGWTSAERPKDRQLRKSAPPRDQPRRPRSSSSSSDTSSASARRNRQNHVHPGSPSRIRPHEAPRHPRCLCQLVLRQLPGRAQQAKPLAQRRQEGRLSSRVLHFAAHEASAAALLETPERPGEPDISQHSGRVDRHVRRCPRQRRGHRINSASRSMDCLRRIRATRIRSPTSASTSAPARQSSEAADPVLSSSPYARSWSARR
jgi:hypothetical protein